MLPARAAKLRANHTMQNNQLPSYYLKMDDWGGRKKKETPFDPRIATMNLLLSKRKDKLQKIKDAGGTSTADSILEEFYLWAPSYKPRKGRRVRLSKDLSKSREPHPVPMYCDLRFCDKRTTPDPRRFSYIVRNEILNVDLKEEVIVKKCDCSGDCDENCECFKFGIDMNNGQVEFIDGSLRITNPETDVYTHALIVCGPLCKCGATCPRRLENMMKKFKFEVYRRDPEVGFGVRTLSNIAFGELVMEFVGEVVPETEIPERDVAEDYALELSNGEDKRLIRKAKTLIPTSSPEAWKSFLDQSEMLLIDGSIKGNLSRFILNGCWPNLQLIRVIENYIDPRCHRLFLYATHDIPAGMELTFFYGDDYLNSDERKFECKCKTLLCEQGGGSRLLKEIHPNQVKKAIANVLQIWREMVEKGREMEAAREKALLSAKKNDDVEEENLDYSADVSDEEESSYRHEFHPRREEEIEVIVLSSDHDESQEDSDSGSNAAGNVVESEEKEDVSDDDRYQKDASLHLQDEPESDSDEEEEEREDGEEEPVLRDENGESAEVSSESESESDSDDDGGEVDVVNEEHKDTSAVAEQPLQHGGEDAVYQEEDALQPEVERQLTEEVYEDHLQDEEYSEFLETGRTNASWVKKEKERRARELELEYLEGVHPNHIGDAYKQKECDDPWRGRRIIVHSLPSTEEQELIEFEKRRAAAAAEAERLKAEAAAREAERVKKDTVAEEPHPLSSRGRFRDLAQNMFRGCHGERLQGQSSTEYDRQSDHTASRKRTREEPGEHQRRQGGQLHAEQRDRYESVNSEARFREGRLRNDEEYDKRQKRPFPDSPRSSRDIPLVTLSSDEEDRRPLQRKKQHLQKQPDRQTHRSSHRDSTRFQDSNRHRSAPRGYNERTVSREGYEDYSTAAYSSDDHQPLAQWSPCPSQEYRPSSPSYPQLDEEEMATDENQLFRYHGDQRRRQDEEDRRWDERKNQFHGLPATHGVQYQRQDEGGRYEDHQWDERDNQFFHSHEVQRPRRHEEVRFEDRRWDERENESRGRSVIATEGDHPHRRHQEGRDDHRSYNESYKRRTMDYEYRGGSSYYDSYPPRSGHDGCLEDSRRPYEPHSPEILRKPSPEPWENSRSSDWGRNSSFGTGYPRNEGYRRHGDEQQRRRDERGRQDEGHHQHRRQHGSYNEGRRMNYY